MSRLERLLANLYDLASFQLLHAAQAVDLGPGFVLGVGTRPLYQAYRRHVPFVAQDRVLTPDLACGAQLFQAWRPGQDAIEPGRAPACSR